MILAPRSWPSNPTFATTTLTVSAMSVSPSDRYRYRAAILASVRTAHVRPGGRRVRRPLRTAHGTLTSRRRYGSVVRLRVRASQPPRSEDTPRKILVLGEAVLAQALYRRRFAVGAVDLLHGGADLTYRGVGADGLEGRVHRVLALFGHLLDRLQALLDLLVVAALFQLFQ